MTVLSRINSSFSSPKVHRSESACRVVINISSLSLFLAVLNELCSPKNNITANQEKLVELFPDGVAPFQLCGAQFERS